MVVPKYTLYSLFFELIEIMQLLLRKGLYEFDDLFHNIFEWMVGYILFIGLVREK